MDGTVDLGVSLGRRLEKRDLGAACTLARRVHSRVRASRPHPPTGPFRSFIAGLPGESRVQARLPLDRRWLPGGGVI